MNNEEKDHIDELLEEYEVSKDEQDFQDAGQIEKLTNEIDELKNKLLKQAADSDNFRKRMIKETEDKIKYANQSLASKFLPVIDNFDLALKHTDEDKDTIIEGLRLNRNVMVDTLSKSGISIIEANPGDVFNPDIHEAISICNIEQMPDNTVSVVIQNGYKMYDRIIRPVKVQVNKKN